MNRSGLPSSELVDWLWGLVWSGIVTTDTFETVRRAMTQNFQAPKQEYGETSARGIPGSWNEPGYRGAGRRSLRRRFQNWRNSMPFPGAWFRPVQPDPPETPMDQEELLRDRGRWLLDLYGVVFRELLESEQPGFQWRDLFRTFQLMELAGEINAGLFFHGISGIQFASHGFLKMISISSEEDSDQRATTGAISIYSMSACDPASVCGLRLDGLPAGLPDRRRTNRLVFRGSQPVLLIENSGRKLTFRLEPDDGDMPEVLNHLARAMERVVMPVTRITVNTINDEPADASRYVETLRTRFDMDCGGGKIVLYRKF